MELLLNRRRSPEKCARADDMKQDAIAGPDRHSASQSIRGRLRAFFRSNLILMVFLFIAGIGAFSISAVPTARENRVLFRVNRFYTDLQQEQSLLYKAVSTQDETVLSQLSQWHHALADDLNQMKNVTLSAAFSREVHDLSGYLDSYQTVTDKISDYIFTGSQIGMISEEYHTAQDIYDAIYSTFHTVYSLVIAKFETQEERVSGFRAAYVAVFALTVLVFIYYMLREIRSIENAVTEPISRLEEDMEQASLNRFEQVEALDCPPSACTDIQALIRIYNSMLLKIQQQLLAQRKYAETEMQLKEQELLNLKISNELKRSHLNNLQAQINPHFLFNTLNMISQTAYMNDDQQTVSLLEAASDLLRYSLDYSDKPVTLEQELENIGNYVLLQETRFGDRIRFIFHLDERFHQVKIPNLIIQPLVENAVKHGVGMYHEGARIEIRTKYEPETHFGDISVIDNGEGMSEQTIQQVSLEIRSKRQITGKIGLANVYQRLMLFFNGKADLILRSEPGARTEVTIRIPVEEEYVSSIDCG